MASPFHVFRKHQRVMLVVVGLLAIISFVFLGTIRSGMGGRTHAEANNPLVVTSDYGDLHLYDVRRLHMLQSILYSFLNSADQESWLKSGGDPNRWSPKWPMQISNRDAAETFLLAGRADDMGIVVDDDVIIKRLELFGLSENRLRELLDNYRFEGGPMTTRHLFDAFRLDLKASRVRQAYGLAGTQLGPPSIYTPADSFESYCKLNEQVQIESVAVPAEQFVDQVKDPSPSQLQEFFDKYKDQVETPLMVGGVQMAASEPGFKLPQRVQVHYLEANYLAYLDLAKQEITDEQIAKYYEENKRQFEKINLMDAPGEATPGGLDLKLPELDKLPGEGTNTPEEKSPEAAPEKEGTKEPTGKEPAGEEKPTGSEEKPAEEKPAPAAEKPAGEEKPAEEEKKPATAEPQSLILDGSKAQFVSLQADAEGAAAEKPAEAKPTEEKPAAETPAAEEKPAAEEPAEKKAAVVPAALPEGTPPEPSSTDTPESELPQFKQPATETPAEGTTGEKKPSPNAEVVQYKSLEEVTDEIRQTLAEQRAGLDMLAAVEPLKLELQEYWKRKVVAKLKAHDDATPILPEGFLAKAEKANMVYHETTPAFLSIFQLAEIPLGQARVTTGETMAHAQQTFVDYAFRGQLDLFQPVLAEGDDGNKYLAWKVGEKQETVPDLQEVRDEVIRAWKLVEARPLAEAEAKRIAAKAKEQGVPLDKALGDEDLSVLFSAPFTWLTRGNVSPFDFRAQSRLSEISGVTGADNEFMKKIFGMKVGEIEVIENYPKSAFYVVRLSQKVIPMATLRENYLQAEQTNFFLRPWDLDARRKVASDVYDALLAEVDLDAHAKWYMEKDELDTERSE